MNRKERADSRLPRIDEVISLARKAGETALRYFRDHSSLTVSNKLNDSDIVTSADKESEAIVSGFIRSHYPDHSILSEESGGTEGTAGVRWVVDPIDGTTNFFAGIPFWAVSIGIERDGIREMGVVYAPATGELFHAVRGEGAFLNGRPIQAASQTVLSRAVVSTGFPVDKDVNPDNNLDNVARILPHIRDLRRLGAAAVDICYVAAGILDAYWELNLHEWDVHAATLILEEASGETTRFREDRGISALFSSKPLHAPLLALLNRHKWNPTSGNHPEATWRTTP